jgi:hypothetical protein
MDATARFIMLNSCGPGAKRLVAERDTLASERDGLKTLFDRARANADAAVSRAESRASTQQKRTDHAQGTIAAAPRAMAMAISCATLAACASSPSKPMLTASPDPVIETRIVERTVCPVDITAPLASRPQPADDAVVTGNTAGMAWVSAISPSRSGRRPPRWCGGVSMIGHISVPKFALAWLPALAISASVDLTPRLAAFTFDLAPGVPVPALTCAIGAIGVLCARPLARRSESTLPGRCLLWSA